jgi:hypothetical protein
MQTQNVTTNILIRTEESSYVAAPPQAQEKGIRILPQDSGRKQREICADLSKRTLSDTQNVVLGLSARAAP